VVFCHNQAEWYGVVYGACCGKNNKYREIGCDKLIRTRTISNLYQSMMGNDGRIIGRDCQDSVICEC
jgi:hypothetical protein